MPAPPGSQLQRSRRTTEPEADVLDNLDSRRHFEIAYPDLGRALAEASAAPVPTAARAMIAIAAHRLGDVPGNSARLRQALLALIDRAEGAAL